MKFKELYEEVKNTTYEIMSGISGSNSFLKKASKKSGQPIWMIIKRWNVKNKRKEKVVATYLKSKQGSLGRAQKRLLKLKSKQ